MKACVPPPPTPYHPIWLKFKCWNPNPHCDDIGRWDLWDVIRSWEWSLIKGISALNEEAEVSFLAHSSNEDRVGRQLPELGSTLFAGALILDFPRFQENFPFWACNLKLQNVFTPSSTSSFSQTDPSYLRVSILLFSFNSMWESGQSAWTYLLYFQASRSSLSSPPSPHWVFRKTPCYTNTFQVLNALIKLISGLKLFQWLYGLG